MIAFFKKHKLLVMLWALALVVIGGFGVFMWQQTQAETPVPQTTTAEKTTLRQIVSASGKVDSSGQISVTTQASGKVKKVYVTVGASVKKGDKILEIDPDQTTIQSQKEAWSAYLAAKNNLNQANAKLYTLKAAEAAAEQKFNQEVADKGLTESDLLYVQLKNALQAAQADYKNQQGVIAQTKAAVDNAYSEYLQTSATVAAPADGVIQDLVFAEGAYITSSSGSSGGTGGGTSVATLKISDKVTAKINVSELDIAGVKTGQDVTLTFTALPGKTYHGKIISVASTGTTESNITTFPVVVEITDASPEILVGMAVSGDITIQVKENVLALSNQAITSIGTKHTVTVLKDGQQQTVDVTVGLVLDTQSEITSGLSEGDMVVIPSSSSTSSETELPEGPRIKGGQ